MSGPVVFDTCCGSGQRWGRDKIDRIATRLVADEGLALLMRLAHGPVFILNMQRQLVALNDQLQRLVGRPRAELLGQRPGEVFGCQVAIVAGGCSRSERCWYCHVGVQAGRFERGCEDQARGVGALDVAGGSLTFAYRAETLTVDDERLTIYQLQDLRDHHQLEVLQRLLFHDLMNEAGGIAGLVDVIREDRPGEDMDLLAWSVDRLIEELRYHRGLLAAEAGRQRVMHEMVDVRDLVAELGRFYQGGYGYRGRLRIAGPDQLLVETDRTLLRRVLGNLIKNAYEAEPNGTAIDVQLIDSAAGIEVVIHNPSAMPAGILAHLFQRTCSTKAETGRGLGTYAARLLCERALGGRLTVASDAAAGTTFTCHLPHRLPDLSG